MYYLSDIDSEVLEVSLQVHVAVAFTGDATYYSDGTIGQCSQRRKPPGFRKVALNERQFGDGRMCGTCVQGSYREGYPIGSGRLYASH